MSIFCLYKFFCFYGVKFLPFSTGPKNKKFLDLVTEQARKIAKEAVMKSAGHMVLENQEALKEIDLQIALLTQELLHKKWKELWDYEI